MRVDIYPVGWLAAWKHRKLRYEWRYVVGRVRARNWRAVRNTFNGYLAEPVECTLPWRRCGHGWTRGRAVADLHKHLAEIGG